MQRKASDKANSSRSFQERKELEEEDFQLIGREIKEALKNIGSEEGDGLSVMDEKSAAKKEETKPARIEVVKLGDKPVKIEPVKEEKTSPTKEAVKEQQAIPRNQEEEPLDKLVKKVDEVYETLDELSRALVQLNKDLKNKIDLINTEMDGFAANLKDASGILERVRGEVQAAPPSAQLEKVGEREPTFAAPRQQQPPPAPPPQSYQPQSYQPPPQQSYQPPSYGYQSPPPQQPQYYGSRPPYPPQSPPPTPPPSMGLSPEEAVARGVEMLKGTVFSDVIASLDQVASIIFSRLLDVREKILRLDPQFPLQEFEPALSELRANPRMKLAHVDKRKLVDKMVNWANRLPRPP